MGILDVNLNAPIIIREIATKAEAIGFTLSSDLLTGSLLRMLATTKPGGKFLELGTGYGMGTAWLLEGMNATSQLVTVERNEENSAIARGFLGKDSRVTFYTGDGETFIAAQQEATFDFIFADTPPGKFTHLNETLQLLKEGGLYIIDDLRPQPGWVAEHLPRVEALIATLEQRADLHITKLDWSTGLIVAAKK